jgi:flagellar basal body-associated protein FliL
MKGKVKKLVVVLLAVIVLSALAAPVVAEEKVTRSVSTTNPAPNEEFDVTLTVGFQIGGIVETIPEGFTFVSTTHPPEQYNVSGQNIRFVVINEPEIKYSVKAPSSGRGTFKGVWEDVLNETNGTLADTNVAIKSAGGGGSKSAVIHSRMPWFIIITAIVVAAIVVIGVATYFPVFPRKGKEEKGDKK